MTPCGEVIMMIIMLLLYIIPISFIIYKACQPRQYDYYPDSDSETTSTTHRGGTFYDSDGLVIMHGLG